MSNTIAAIDFGTSKIVTVIAEDRSTGRCALIGTGNVPYNGYKDGEWIDEPEDVMEAVRNAVNAAELEAETRIHEIYVGVPCDSIKTLTVEKDIDLGESRSVTDEDVLAVQDAAAEELGLPEEGAVVIHRSVAWLSLDGGKPSMMVPTRKGKTLRAKVSFILADSYFIENVSAMMNKLGISVYGFLSVTFAEIMHILDYDDRDKCPMLVDVGYLNTDIAVAQGDAIVYHAVLPFGGGDITAALTEPLRIHMNSAEKVKREFRLDGDPDFEGFEETKDIEVRGEKGTKIRFKYDTVKDIVEKEMDEFVEMLSSTIEEAQPFMTNRSQIYLTGGGIALMNGGREYLANKLELPVKVPLLRATKLNGAQFASAQSLVDLIFASIESHTPQEGSFPGRVAKGVRGIFSKFKSKS